MSNLIEVLVPDIGDFDSVDVIEVLVNVGDSIEVDDSLVTVESDKASMDIPSSHAGVVKEVKVSLGDKISQGNVLLMIEAAANAGEEPAKAEAPKAEPTKEAPAAASAPTTATPTGNNEIDTQVVVLGSGPGGYTAAFRAADLGLKVVLIERYSTLGGVCLNVGCIPSKALLHTAKVITEAEETEAHGLNFGKPNIDLDKLRKWKSDDVVGKLTGGLAQMAKGRGVTVVNGVGRFTGANQITVTVEDDKTTKIGFENAIIAAGSQATKFPGLDEATANDPRVMDSTGALALEDIPKSMLVIGGGIIGLELGTVYDAMGTKVSVVEFMDSLVTGCDRDLVRPLQKRMSKRFESIMLSTKVANMAAKKDGIHVNFEGENAPEDTLVYDRVLISIGRRPNGKNIGAENAGVAVNDYGFIDVDKQQRTNVPHIFAIGDIVGQPMLAHKATHEAKVSAEVIAGHKVEFVANVIPSVAYTDPEIAWVGVTETEAKEKGMDVDKASFPWAASGRAIAVSRTEGVTKLIFDKTTHRLIGAGIVGVNAGELLAEACLAIEMGADAHDLGLTIHAHPTLSETICFAAELKEGTITDMMPPKKR
ncbi:MAG: dihydrolipoamide dehydrogenase [Methylophilaceae bacterium]|jgi:dihydrolipoamide dehydrogenase